MKIRIKTNKGYKDLETPTFSNGNCSGCGKDIYWVEGKSGKPMPLSRLGNGDLVSHFFDCPQASQFRKSDEKK
jgi:hypothetical protein